MTPIEELFQHVNEEINDKVNIVQIMTPKVALIKPTVDLLEWFRAHGVNGGENKDLKAEGGLYLTADIFAALEDKNIGDQEWIFKCVKLEKDCSEPFNLTSAYRFSHQFSIFREHHINTTFADALAFPEVMQLLKKNEDLKKQESLFSAPTPLLSGTIPLPNKSVFLCFAYQSSPLPSLFQWMQFLGKDDSIKSQWHWLYDLWVNRDSRTTQAIILCVAYMILDTLETLHSSKKAVHLDLKPANILFGPVGPFVGVHLGDWIGDPSKLPSLMKCRDDQVSEDFKKEFLLRSGKKWFHKLKAGEYNCHIIDFESSQSEDLEEEYWAHEHYSGTPRYSAPEHILGQKVDGKADIYSLGILLRELSGRPLPPIDSLASAREFYETEKLEELSLVDKYAWINCFTDRDPNSRMTPKEGLDFITFLLTKFHSVYY